MSLYMLDIQRFDMLKINKFAKHKLRQQQIQYNTNFLSTPQRGFLACQL